MASDTQKGQVLDSGTTRSLEKKLDELFSVNKATNAAIESLTSFLREHAATTISGTARDNEIDCAGASGGGSSFFDSSKLNLENLRPIGSRDYSNAVKVEWTNQPSEHLLLDTKHLSLKVLWEDHDLTSTANKT
jgi:hypothetical protein